MKKLKRLFVLCIIPIISSCGVPHAQPFEDITNITYDNIRSICYNKSYYMSSVVYLNDSDQSEFYNLVNVLYFEVEDYYLYTGEKSGPVFHLYTTEGTYMHISYRTDKKLLLEFSLDNISVGYLSSNAVEIPSEMYSYYRY